MGKGEVARDEQFLLFPVFSKHLYCRHVKPGLVWERVKKQPLSATNNSARLINSDL